MAHLTPFCCLPLFGRLSHYPVHVRDHVLRYAQYILLYTCTATAALDEHWNYASRICASTHNPLLDLPAYNNSIHIRCLVQLSTHIRFISEAYWKPPTYLCNCT